MAANNQPTEADIAERRKFQHRVAELGLTLTAWDFAWIDGGWTIDGMDVEEWISNVLED